jgi:hypothetical protein
MSMYNGPRLAADDNGGTCSRILDFSNPAPDEAPAVSQLAPGLFAVELPWRPVLICHTWDVSDSSAPIFTTGKLAEPGSFAFADMHCRGCESRLVISQGPDSTWLLVEHDGGCGALEEMAARG